MEASEEVPHAQEFVDSVSVATAKTVRTIDRHAILRLISMCMLTIVNTYDTIKTTVLSVRIKSE